MSEYATTQRSSLKLKGLGSISAGKKKKKKDKESKHRLEQVVTSQNDEEEGVKTKKAYIDKRTPAQIAFDKMQEKRQMERILNKASKTHKHRVEVSHARLGIAPFSQTCCFRRVKQPMQLKLFKTYECSRMSKN
uniref:protein FAM32A-like isoform X1 n=1 Tax=Scatophagus argus TaxID=75038 RepID=UPI001ED7D909|nr:protein FAM32A-like isoform X1 [Scatophagus argus]